MSESKLGLKVISGKKPGEVFPLNKSKFIGSQPDCEIHFPEWGVEPVHARVKLRSDGCVIVNLAETVTLKVNGQDVRAVKLKVGDQVEIGETLLLVVDLAAAEPEPQHEDRAVLLDRADEPAATESAIPRTHEHEAEHDKSIARKGRLFVYAALALLLVTVSYITVQELVERGRQKEMLNAAYSDAVEYSQAHPTDYDKIVAKYGAVLAIAMGQNKHVETFVRQEISRIETERAAKESQYKVLLDALDRKVEDLVQRNAYAEAEAAYRECDARLRTRVLADRSVHLDEIKRLASVYAERLAEETAKAEIERKAAREQLVRRDLDRRLVEIVELMIKGQSSAAERDLHKLIGESRFERFRPALDTALTTVELLGSYDRVQKMSADAKCDSSTGGVAVAAESSISPVVDAVLALRRAETNAAIEKLEKDETHILSTVIRDMSHSGKDNSEIVSVWNINTGDKVTGRPTPEEMVIFLERKALELEDAELEKLCKALLVFKDVCTDKGLISRHSVFFETARKLLAQMNDGGGRQAGAGD